MSHFNTVVTPLKCPWCAHIAEHDVEVKIGDTTQQATLRPGDHYPWRKPERWMRDFIPDDPSFRPQDGTVSAEGYAVCPACDRDFFATIEIVKDIIRSVVPDRTRPPFMR